MNRVTFHESRAEHDEECPVMTGEEPTALHFRVTRPLAYPLGSPGCNDPSARQGHYTDACCATRAAGLVRARLKASPYHFDKLSELDVQVWR